MGYRFMLSVFVDPFIHFLPLYLFEPNLPQIVLIQARSNSFISLKVVAFFSVMPQKNMERLKLKMTKCRKQNVKIKAKLQKQCKNIN